MNDQPHAHEPLTDEAVRKVARLARLTLTDEQIADQRQKLTSVLGYIDRLQKMPLDDVEPLACPAEQTNRLDADTPGPTLPTEALLKMAPAAFDRYVQVPKVLGDSSSS